MASADDKAQKLKEIQDRLAEIQSKSGGKPASRSTTSKPKSEAKPVSKPTSESLKKEPVPPTKSQDSTNKPKGSEPEKQKTNTDKTFEKKSDSPKPKETTPAAEKRSQLKSNGFETSNKKSDDSSWSGNQVKGNEKEEKSKPEKAKSNSGNKLKLLYTIISLIITAGVASYLVMVYVFPEDQSAVLETTLPALNEDKEADEPSAEEISDEATGENENAETTTTEAITQKEPEVEASQKPKKIQAREQPTREKQAPAIKSAKKVIPSGFIISYASNSTEKMAKSNVSMLQGKGFNAAYYYMPDHEVGSPSLYKVYVGPFSDESAAMPTFKKVVDINDKAFILKMN